MLLLGFEPATFQLIATDQTLYRLSYGGISQLGAKCRYLNLIEFLQEFLHFML